MLYKNCGLLSEKWLSSTRHWLWGQMMFLCWAGARAECLIHGRFLSLLPSVHRCPQLFSTWEDSCLVAWGRSYSPSWLGAQLGAVEILSWLVLSRCGCLRISQQSFLLFVEASPSTVPLGATRGLLPPSGSGAKMMDYCLILLGLVCFTEWLPVWVRELLFSPTYPLLTFGEELVCFWSWLILLPFGLFS